MVEAIQLLQKCVEKDGGLPPVSINMDYGWQKLSSTAATVHPPTSKMGRSQASGVGDRLRCRLNLF